MLLLTFWNSLFAALHLIIINVENPHSKAVLLQADEMQKAVITKDYKTVLKYTHPKIVQLMGGPEKGVETLQVQFSAMEKQGVVINDCKFGEPSDLYVVGKELQCTIPQSLEMTIPAGKLVANSTLIGFSENDGKTWVFLDPSQGLDKIRTVLPNISKKIEIPPSEKPQFFPK